MFTLFTLMKAAATTPETLSQPTEALHFSLAHPFINEVIRSLDRTASLAELQTKLRQMSAHQIDAFVREQYGMPLQPTYELIARGGGRLGIQLFDRRYPGERDTLAVAEAGVAVAQTAAEAQRYQLELRQVEHFNQTIKIIMQQGKWTECSALPGDNPETGNIFWSMCSIFTPCQNPNCTLAIGPMSIFFRWCIHPMLMRLNGHWRNSSWQ